MVIKAKAGMRKIGGLVKGQSVFISTTQLKIHLSKGSEPISVEINLQDLLAKLSNGGGYDDGFLVANRNLRKYAKFGEEIPVVEFRLSQGGCFIAVTAEKFDEVTAALLAKQLVKTK